MSERDLSIVVLAAGQGTRMKSLLPKVLHTIGGKSMLAHVIETAKKLEPSQIIVVHGFGGEKLQQAFLKESLTWVNQPEQLGTGDAVAKALPHIPPSHRVLILYADVPLITVETLQHLLKCSKHAALGLLTVTSPSPKGLGRIVRELGKIKKIVEERDATLEERQLNEVNTGIFAVKGEKLHSWLLKLTNHNAQQEYYLTDIIELAVKEQEECVTAHLDAINEVQGINDRVQQAIVERYYQQRQAHTLMQQGVRIVDPARFEVRGQLTAEADVEIDINAVFEGNNFLASGCQIGPNCILINCQLGNNVKILANSYLEGAIIKENAVIGPFARLRPQTILEPHVHIGNFVEIKNTSVGAYSKINHLSYIGDALIGQQVNIGAGTITCNYDGANKHQTIIEDEVHIGSDSQLIAPVRVKKGATIAAGSTLVKDAPSFLLTLTHRLEQRTQDWQRPQKQAPNTSSKGKE